MLKLPNTLMTAEQVAEFLNIGVGTVKSYVVDGKLKPVKNLGVHRFLPDEVASFIGADVGALSPLVFKKLNKELAEKDRRIEELENELTYKNEKLNKIKTMIGD